MIFDIVSKIQYYKTTVDRFVITVRPPYQDEDELEFESFWTLNVSNVRDEDHWKHTHDDMGREIDNRNDNRYLNSHFNGFSTKEEAFEFAEKYVNFLIDTLPF